MKFKPVNPKEKWSAEKTQARINETIEDVKEIQRRMNKIDSEMNALKDEKRNLASKMGNKEKYIKQLNEQLSIASSALNKGGDLTQQSN